MTVVSHFEVMSAEPISIHNATKVTHSSSDNKINANQYYAPRKISAFECIHPLEYEDSDESEEDESCCRNSEDEVDGDEDTFINSVSSYLSSINSTQFLLSTPSTSISPSFQNSFLFNKRRSISQALIVNVNVSSLSLGLGKKSSSTKLAELLEKFKQEEQKLLFQSQKALHLIKSNSTASILKSYLRIDFLSDLFGFKSSSDITLIPATTSPSSSAQELCTFPTSNSRDDNIIDNEEAPRKKPLRNREIRINSRFLLIYSFDFNARANGYLPNHVGETQNFDQLAPSIRNFHAKYNLQKVSNLSRDKLWDNVILQARNDPLPEEFINYENYIQNEVEEEQSQTEGIKRNRNHSIIKLEGSDFLPWINLENSKYQTVKPAGILKTGKTLYNGELPSSGLARTQFTVKGWCNQRWVSQS